MEVDKGLGVVDEGREGFILCNELRLLWGHFQVPLGKECRLLNHY